MNEKMWENEYEQLLQESLARGEIDQGGEEAERRRHPRFKLRSESVWIRVEAKFAVVDVSLSGIALNSTLPFDAGRVINVMVGKAFAVEARVVGCHLMESDPHFMEAMYRVHCEFMDEMQGRQVLVLMKEMDDLDPQ